MADPTTPTAAAIAPDDGPREDYVFAGGGTGGHLFPAIAVARALRERNPDCGILFVGSDREHEQSILHDASYAHHALQLLPRSQGLRRPFAFAAALWRSCREMRRRFQEQPPRVVIGCGGWSSVPTVWAARQSRVPIVLLEQNVLPGKATRQLSRWANVVCLSFEESRQWLGKRVTAVVTGNPVRREIADLWRPPAPDDAAADGSFPAGVIDAQPSHPLLLVLGGSLGSEEINNVVLMGLTNDPDFWRYWEIVHQTGGGDFQRVCEAYRQLGRPARVEPFLSDVPALLGRATVVLSRAGATTLAELACAGAPSVIVPWRGAADDHQLLNARWYVDRKAMLRPSDERGDIWLRVLMLATYPNVRQQRSRNLLALARPHATQAVLEVLDATATRRPG